MILFVKWNARSLNFKYYIANYARVIKLYSSKKYYHVFPKNTEVVNMFTTKKLKII